MSDLVKKLKFFGKSWLLSIWIIIAFTWAYNSFLSIPLNWFSLFPFIIYTLSFLMSLIVLVYWFEEAFK